MEKYTLYFKLNNKYGHDKKIPIVTLDLKEMDKFTGMYSSYFDLYKDLPLKEKSFIEKEIRHVTDLKNEEKLKNFFGLMNEKGEESFALLSNDLDVIYITPDELTKKVVEQKMSFIELEQALLKSRVRKNIEKRYEFFKYLYYTYVKNKKVIGMMDTYDISKKLPMLKDETLMIGAIATDKDNLILLSKKIGQKSKDRRNLAYKLKELYLSLQNKESFVDINLINERKEIKDSSHFISEMIDNFDSFKKNYDEEYK